MKRRIGKPSIELPLMILLIIMGYVFLHDLLGGTLFDHEPLDSYTLQAMAWLKGQVYLADGQDYPWLELAIYGGKYYVSFPPVPSLVMLPLALHFHENTPNNLIVAVYAIMAVIGAYRACRIAGMNTGQSCFLSLFVVMGCNMMEISTSGGVWLQAQTLNMALLAWGVSCALKNRRVPCMILLALAVGCRPFSILYIIVALYYFYRQDRKTEPGSKPISILIRLWKAVLAAAVIGFFYMWYNFIRFGNPLEFGHNYLPEMMNSDYGQFSIHYLGTNLYNIFCRPVTLTAKAKLCFPIYNGFMFYVVNPIFIVWFVQVVRDLRGRRMTGPMAVTCIGLAVNLLCLCLHKSFGGFQFGARYTIDLIAYVLFYLLLSGKKEPALWERFLCGFGLLFNGYGTLLMRLYKVL